VVTQPWRLALTSVLEPLSVSAWLTCALPSSWACGAKAAAVLLASSIAITSEAGFDHEPDDCLTSAISQVGPQAGGDQARS